MKIIEQRRRDEDAKRCLDCGGSEDIMISLEYGGYLCLSCAHEAGAMAEEVRERGNDIA
ncbi:MAG: hypothetical protein KDK05_23965 [Candidatus Competibacteraceae bacterium]|nr:hypothetical protein [Candidatus Competibacteraceae bacterium]